MRGRAPWTHCAKVAIGQSCHGVGTMRPVIGVIGGSGFYTFFGPDARSVVVETPLRRTQRADHHRPGGRARGSLPAPARTQPRVLPCIPCPTGPTCGRCAYWCATGVRTVRGRQPDRRAPAGAIVVPDQLVDRTRGRDDTYFDAGGIHVEFADPYCPTLRAVAADTPGVVDGGTMVVIQGPGSPPAPRASGSPGRASPW